MLELTAKQALRNRSLVSRWPGRDQANRLEPECWPVINPAFKLDRSMPVFTIGSCFARNIEFYLSNLGFEVPVRSHFERYREDFGEAGTELLNKYSPPSIWQELSWTKRILDRDSKVTDEDIEHFLLPLPNGNVVDLQRRAIRNEGVTRVEALRQRQNLFGLFQHAFTCPVVIITLGLVETWYDTQTKQYVEFSSHLMEHGNRFVFRRLDYPECYENIRSAIELLDSCGSRKILLTTSPIPLGRTFTDDDVIVANTYSKSVLRAVAGRIAADFPSTDYFPSFESVMLTKDPNVWENDLRHVAPSFVGRVMARVVSAYVGDAVDRTAEAALEIEVLISGGKLDEASALYLTFENELAVRQEPKILLAKAKVLHHLGRSEESLESIAGFREWSKGRGIFAPPELMLLFDCYVLLGALGVSEGASVAMGMLVNELSGSPGRVRMVASLISKDPWRKRGLAEFLKRVEATFTHDDEIQAMVGRIRAASGSSKRTNDASAVVPEDVNAVELARAMWIELDNVNAATRGEWVTKRTIYISKAERIIGRLLRLKEKRKTAS